MDKAKSINKPWQDKFILLGVTGSIAAYKSAEILRRIQDKGAEIQVIMTRTATQFITPETLKQLSGNKVLIDIFDDKENWKIGHISLSERSDAMLIAPATANIIGKMANGIADDLLSTIAMSISKPIVVAPAMNDAMFNHPATQWNMNKLKEYGIFLIPPAKGYLACGRIGVGRMAEVENILGGLGYVLQKNKDLKNKKILISAGPTQEFIDPVRFISNASSGKMGYALATAAYQRGAQVTLISGPTKLYPPYGVNFIEVRTADQLHREIFNYYYETDIVIMSAAVSDYKPDKYQSNKLKKAKVDLELVLKPTIDILSELGENKNAKILVGFAAETDNLLENAKNKLQDKNLDLIILNDISRADIGFGSDNNEVILLNKEGQSESSGLLSKMEIADWILDRIVLLIKRGLMPKV